MLFYDNIKKIILEALLLHAQDSEASFFRKQTLQLSFSWDSTINSVIA